MSDLVVTVRQISNYPPTTAASSGDNLLMQAGGPGAPYASINAADLVATALYGGPSMGVGMAPPGNAIGGGIFTGQFVMPTDGAQAWNAYVDTNFDWRLIAAGSAGSMGWDQNGFNFEVATQGSAGQTLTWVSMMRLDNAGNLALPYGTIGVARDPAANNEVVTLNYLANNTVQSFNNRKGAVQLNAQDVYNALKLCDPIATQPWVQNAINNSIKNLLYTCPFVNTWNGRKGSVYLMLSDITTVFYQSGQQPVSPTPIPTSNDDSIATTKWVTENFGSSAYLPLSGGVLTGPVTASNPLAPANQIFLQPPSGAGETTPNGAQLHSYLAFQPDTQGVYGDVFSNIRVDNAVTGNPLISLWGVTSVIDYQGTGGNAGYVGFYAQTNRNTYSPGGAPNNPELWGATLEVRDITNTDSGLTNSLNGLEIDITCGSTDSAKNRRAIGIYLNPSTGTDAVPTCDLGIHVAANQGSYNRVFASYGLFNEAVFDARESTPSSAAAHAIWLADSGDVAWNTNGVVRTYYDPTIFGSGGVHFNSPTQFDGAMHLVSGLIVDGGVTFNNSITADHWIFAAYNAAPEFMPPVGNYGAFGWNASNGQGEVSYINAFGTPGFSHIFWQQTGAGAATRLMDIGTTGNVTAYAGFTVNTGGPTIRAGTGAATGTQPAGSLWMRTDGAVGSHLYVSAGGGTWNAVAGV